MTVAPIHAEIIIVGGSLTGATLALALAGAGFSVAVVDAGTPDRQAAPGFDGRSYAMALASVRMLGTLGLWPVLAATAQPINHIKVSDGRAGRGPGPFVMEFDGTEIDDGPMGHMVEDRHLRPALLTALAAAEGVTHLTGRRVLDQTVAPGRVTITLDDGSQLTGACLVGADGRGGAVGTRAGLTRRVRDYRQTSLVCAISHEKPHGGVAHQFFMPEGPLAILPLTGQRCSIVWTERTDRAQAIQALDDAGYLAVLRPRFGDFLGDIALAGARYTYPLNLSLADHFIAERVALVGDAARGIHPIAGQGLNAGLRDAAALAQTLTDARRRGEDPGTAAVLARYQRWRRFDSTALAAATDGFNRLFSNDNPILRLGRDLGLGAVNAVPALRGILVREAAGLSGDLPRLMRGEAI